MTPKDEPPRSEGIQYVTGEEQRTAAISSRKNEVAGSKQKQFSLVDVSGDESKTWCCKEQHCIGTWNFRPMNQCKLNVVKQEMARVNINILGISELKWTGIGEVYSDDHYIYFCGQQYLPRNGVALTVNKRDQNAVPGCNLKSDKMILVSLQGKPFKITVNQVYVTNTNAEETEVDHVCVCVCVFILLITVD